MGEHIECRYRNGDHRFRIWSSGVQGYYTAELTKPELLRYLRQRELERALRVQYQHDERIVRAKKKGTSYLIGAAQNLDGPWRDGDDGAPDGKGIDLSDMYFLVVSESDAPLAGVHGDVVQKMLKGSEVEKAFSEWAEFAAYGEVFEHNTYLFVRTLPP